MDKLPFADVYTLQILSKAGYKYKNDIPEEWILVDSREVVSTGFYGKVFKCTECNEIVISFSGTDIKNFLRGKADFTSSVQDILNDHNMAMSKLPKQYKNAKDLYRDVKTKYPKALISLIGESLGGTLAALCGAETGERTYTFRAFGLATALPDSDKKYDNVINIGETKDFVFMANANEHIGRTYVIPDENNNVFMPEFSSGMNFHINGEMCLADAIEYKKDSVKVFQEFSKEEKVAFFKDEISDFVNDKKDMISELIDKTIKKLTSQIFSFSHFVENIAKETQRAIYQKRDELTDGHWVTIDHNHVFIKD